MCEQIGAYLIRNGIITEEEMIRALGHVKHILFIPDEVAVRLDHTEAKGLFNKKKLLEYKILPLTNENGIWIIGICNSTADFDIEKFKKENNIKIRRMYMMEPIIQQILTVEDNKTDNVILSSMKDYRQGLISFEQVILIGKYSILLNKSEMEIRSYMGI